jgi:hypothetical protein
MDWIERIFGVSPDGGSGSLEVLVFMILVVGLCVLGGMRMRRTRERLGDSGRSWFGWGSRQA